MEVYIMTGATYEIHESLSFTSEVVDTKLGKVEIFFTDKEKKDKPVVLCSHGGIGGVDQARLMLDWVDMDRYRLLCVSRPGYLLTPLESGESIEQQADLFASLQDLLDVEKAFVISASAGGPPAYTYAMNYPDRIYGLIPIDSVSGYYDMPETVDAISEMFFTSNMGQKLLKNIGKKKPEWFASQIFKSEAYFTKEQLKKHIEYVTTDETAKKFIQGFMNTMNPYKPRKPGTENDMKIYKKLKHLEVEKINVPTLIIHGTHDADVKFFDGVYAYENIKNAQRYWIEEGSHLAFWLSQDAKNAQKAAQKFMDDILDK
jgi:pimeloyl-ACP methyl ester carboxylesterase